MRSLLPRPSSRAASFWVAPLVAAFLLPVSAGAESGGAVKSFSAPSGNLGGDLSLDPKQRSRLHAEMSYFTRSGGGTVHALAWSFGAGVKVSDHVELQLDIPVAGLVLAGGGALAGGDQFGVGNLALGANYFTSLGRALRFKLGGTVAFGPWNDSNGGVSNEGTAVGVAGLATHGYQELWLFQAGAVHLVAPGRIEIGETLQFTGDFFAHLIIPTIGGDPDVIVTMAPGIAIWPVQPWLFGARMPIQFRSTNSGLGDEAQLDLEPFVRFNFAEHGFVSTRFTIHLDDDLGFSFDSGGFWGWHLAVGGAF